MPEISKWAVMLVEVSCVLFFKECKFCIMCRTCFYCF